MRNYLIKTAITILVSILALNSFGQNSKKETINRLRPLAGLSTYKLKNQKYSGSARELSVEDFINYYIENGEGKYPKKYGYDTKYIDSLYSDTTHVYYIYWNRETLMDFIKVKTADVIAIDIADIDGKFIREKFFDEIVPQSDKERVKKKCKDCFVGLFDHDRFKYHYDKKSRSLEVRFKWKVTFDIQTAINKNYVAYYSIDKKIFQN